MPGTSQSPRTPFSRLSEASALPSQGASERQRTTLEGREPIENAVVPCDSDPLAAESATDDLEAELDWLLTGLEKLGQAAFILTAATRYALKGVQVDQPALMVVLQGEKRLKTGGQAFSGLAGDYLMVHRPGQLVIENVPDPRAGAYRAWGLYFPWALVELARLLDSAHPRLSTGDVRQLPVSVGKVERLRPQLQALLTRIASSQDDLDPVELDHLKLGILVALARSGEGQFLQAADPSLGARIRLLVAANPEKDWESSIFEERLHMSGATLRRRLAEEGTGLRELVREARLHHGLSLLQTSRKPLKLVASACGYRSVSSFSRNFQARFGVEPSRLVQN